MVNINQSNSERNDLLIEMVEIIIKYDNRKDYTKIVGADNLDISMPMESLEDLCNIGGFEIHKETFIEKIKKYWPFGKKQI